jgi:hypothetical protein
MGDGKPLVRRVEADAVALTQVSGRHGHRVRVRCRVARRRLAKRLLMQPPYLEATPHEVESSR